MARADKKFYKKAEVVGVRYEITGDDYNRINYTDRYYTDAADRGEVCPVCHNKEVSGDIEGNEIVKLWGHNRGLNKDLFLYWCPCGAIWSPSRAGGDGYSGAPPVIFDVFGYVEGYKLKGSQGVCYTCDDTNSGTVS